MPHLCSFLHPVEHAEAAAWVFGRSSTMDPTTSLSNRAALVPRRSARHEAIAALALAVEVVQQVTRRLHAQPRYPVPDFPRGVVSRRRPSPRRLPAAVARTPRGSVSYSPASRRVPVAALYVLRTPPRRRRIPPPRRTAQEIPRSIRRAEGVVALVRSSARRGASVAGGDLPLRACATDGSSLAASPYSFVAVFVYLWAH